VKGAGIEAADCREAGGSRVNELGIKLAVYDVS